MNTQRLRTVTPLPPEPQPSEAPAPTGAPLVPAPVVPVSAPPAELTRGDFPRDTQQTSVMRFDDLEEFRQAARAQLKLDAEEDRVTPTGHWVSPFVNAPPPAALETAPLEPPAPLPVPPAPVEVPQSVVPAPTSPATGSAFARGFREASWPKRVTLLLLPIVIGLYGLKAFRHSAAKRAPAPARAAASASASASVGVAASAAPIDSASVVDAAASASGSAPSVAPQARTAGPSLQRRAIDAYANGNFQEASALYRKLVAQFPERPEFDVASQIAAEKAKGAQHD